MRIDFITEKLKDNAFVKNVIILGSGAGIAQVVPALASLLLARIYTKSDFGYLSMFMAITGVIGCIATLRYELAIIIPKKHNDAKNLLILSIVNSLIVSLLCLFLIYLLDDDFVRQRLEVHNIDFLYLIPVMVFLIGINNAFTNWYARIQLYKSMAKVKVLQSVTTAFLKIFFGIVTIGYGLMYGTILGYLMAVLLFLILFWEDVKSITRVISIHKIIKLFREYIDFFKFSTLSGLFNSFSNIGLPMLITFFYGVENAGVYFFSNNLIRLPIQLLTQTISQVYKREASVMFRKSPASLYNFTLKIQLVICCILVPLIFVLSVFGGDIFSFFFGVRWEESGNLIKYISIFILFNNLYSPISSIADIIREQKVLVLFNISLSLSQILILYMFQNVAFTLMLLVISIVGSLHFLILDIYMKLKLRLNN